MADVSWFRSPGSGSDGGAGTLNACYDALDVQVIRGRADEVALSDPQGDWTHARLLTEVGACAGVLRAFGVAPGDEVGVGALSRATGVVVALAVARLGAVASYGAGSGAGSGVAAVVVGQTPEGPAFTADGEDVPWDVAMRAGRTDPAPCADVPGDAVLARHGDTELTVLEALGASEQAPVAPAGGTLVRVGGLTFWTFDGPSG